MGRDDRETFRLIRQGRYTFPEARFSPEAGDFLRSLLRVDASLRLDAAAALAHPWLSSDVADDQAASLDSDVLVGLRAFVKSNALKRAVLSAVAPTASVEEVSRWADQFEGLDKEGTGTIPVKELAERLCSELNASEEEATALAAAAASADGGELISYSAFLAACLSTHMAALKEQQIRELFARLDRDKNGFVSIEELGAGLGDVVDLEELRADLGDSGGELTYDTFCWLLLRPAAGLRHLLSACRSLPGLASWRVETVRARHGQRLPSGDDHDTATEAARCENASWRRWYLSVACNSAEVSPAGSVRAPSPPESVVAVSPRILPKEPSVDMTIEVEGILRKSGEEVASAWAMATAEAKDGSVDASRRENLAWRKWNKEQMDQAGADQCSP
mmetsp:Transcript_17330/g.39292  ORF Transcript_17330/g.39292 Transcript_17330/m.39292 type:complete len:391 (+) Transcript_17330:1-1173(+)